MPASTPTLRDMIQEALDRGQTYEQLAAAAIDERTGERASRSLLNNIVINKVDRMPYDYHLRAIAAALRKPYKDVRQAAINQWLPADAGAATDDESLLREMRRLADGAARIREQVADLMEKAEQQRAGEKPTERETA